MHVWIRAVVALGVGLMGLDAVAKDCKDADKIYKICSDQNLAYKATMDRAKSSSKLVLLSFGADWCPWCVSLHKIANGTEFKKEFDSRLVLHEVGVFRYDSKDKIESGGKILKDVVEANGKKMEVVDGYPFLVMVRPSDGKGVFISTGALEDNSKGKGHDMGKLKTALHKAIAELK